MKKFSKQLKQAGISLLEVLLSLAIIAIILVMAMQYFTTASNTQKLNMVRTFIGADMAAIQGYGINNNGFTSLDWPELVSKGYLSRDTKSLACTTEDSSSCGQKTPWGKDVDIGIDGTTVTLKIPLPSQNLCKSLLESYGPQVVSCDGASGDATVTVSGIAEASTSLL